jgi:hypothetical protein
MQYIGGTNPENLAGVTSASRQQNQPNSNDAFLNKIYEFKAKLNSAIMKQNDSQHSNVLNIYKYILDAIYNYLVNNIPIVNNNTYNANKELINDFINYATTSASNKIFIDYYLKENFKTCPYVRSLPAQEQCMHYNNEKSQA